MPSVRFLVDFSPLRESVPYRTLFWGQLVSLLGSQLTLVALPIQIYLLTRSSLAVGFIGLAQLGPSLLLTLFGGSIADAIDRRRILLTTQLFLLLTTVGLALLSLLPHLPIWLFYLLAAALAGFAGLDGPARGTLTRHLVRRELFPAAAALDALLRQTGTIVGPALAGLLISRFNVSLAYWLDAASYSVALLAVLLLPSQKPVGSSRAVSWSSLREGLQYLRGRRIVQGILLLDGNAMIFGMPQALFPALGLTVFQGGTLAVGWLYAAPALGAFLGAVSSGWIGSIRRIGHAVLVTVGLWGVAITIVGLTSWLPLALLMLVLAGWADSVSEVLRNSMLQLSIPDHIRGRITAIQLAQVTATARAGDVESGLVAAITNAQISVATGGIACILGTLLLAWVLPAFRRYRLDRAYEDEPDASSSM